MKILGLIGSARKLGNSEILVKEAISSIQEEMSDIEIELVRLTDLKIKTCIGCMYCAFSKTKCRLEDDFEYLLDKLKSSQGIVLGAPTYILTPPAIIKAVIDRYLTVAPFINEWNSTARFGITINVAGLPDWNPYNSSLLNIFLFAFQYRLAGAMCAYGPGPGETLLNSANIEKANSLGKNLISRLISSDQTTISLVNSEQNICPSCLSPVFKINEKGEVECPTCGLKGKLQQKIKNEYSIEFSPVLDGFRWSQEEQIKHYEDWIYTSKDNFKKIYPQIKKMSSKYAQMDNLFCKPEN